jgi:hypothetical protein
MKMSLRTFVNKFMETNCFVVLATSVMNSWWRACHSATSIAIAQVVEPPLSWGALIFDAKTSFHPDSKRLQLNSSGQSS